MAVRRSLFDTSAYDTSGTSTTDPNAFLAGGNGFVPPTAQPTTPAAISPNTFLSMPTATAPTPLPGKTIFTGEPTNGFPRDFPPSGPVTIQSDPYIYDPSTTAAPSQPFINRAEDPTFESGLNALYQKYDGRDATPDEMLAHAGNPGGLAAVEAMLKAQGPAAPAGPAGPKGPPPGPTDPMSGPIDAGLMDLIGHHGATPDQTALMKTLTDIISRGGDVDPQIAERSLNMARDAEATAMTGQSNDLRAELAARGRASTPGVTQGGEVDALTRLTEALAPIYSGQVAGIENTAAAAKQSSLHDALSLATGLSSNEAGNLLGTLGSGTQRQTALSNIALEQLQNDQQWNEFLASYGLQKDQVAAMIQQGNIASLVPYLQMFLKQAEQGAQGYIGQNS